MHILASGPEQQAVYSEHLIHPSYSILPPSPKEVQHWSDSCADEDVQVEILMCKRAKEVNKNMGMR